MSDFSCLHLGVIGAGSWGCALAQAFSHHHRVTIYAQRHELIQEINQSHTNHRYLPGIDLTPTITATHNRTDLANCDTWVMATPAQNVRAALEEFSPLWTAHKPTLILTSKGVELETGCLMDEVAHQVLPKAPCLILSGPSFAREVAQSLPAALVLAGAEATLWQRRLATTTLRLYASSDPKGVQMAGAFKNVIALGAGMVMGAGFGENARAALITRGLHEMATLGTYKGGKPETFYGLSGMGDLLLTAMSVTSRNTQLGLLIGQGLSLAQAQKKLHQTTEGVATTAALQPLIHTHHLDLPICQAVHQVLEGTLPLRDAAQHLLHRPFKAE